MRHFEDWKTVATDIPAEPSGTFNVHREAVERLVRPYWGFDGELECMVSGQLTYLRQGGTEWMLDDPVRQRVMELYAAQAQGRVLVGGLGLGLLAHELWQNPRVIEVTTVEKSQNVVDLVPAQGWVIHGDFWEEAVHPHHQYEAIIADLWDAHAAPEVASLFAEVAAKAAAVRQANPQAKLILHGFPLLSDYDPLKEGASHRV